MLSLVGIVLLNIFYFFADPLTFLSLCSGFFADSHLFMTILHSKPACLSFWEKDRYIFCTISVRERHDS